MPDTADAPDAPDAPGERSMGRSEILRASALAALRVAVGVHFVHEGFARLLDGEWTTAIYVERSGWVLAPVFRWAASHPGLLGVVDFVNTWCLVLVGLALVLGCFTRAAAGLGIAFFLVYYVAHPPFVGVALFLPLIFPAGMFLGLDGLIARRRQRGRGAAPSDEAAATSPSDRSARGPLERREVLAGLAAVPFLGTFAVAVLTRRGWTSHEEERLQERRAGTGDEATAAPASPVIAGGEAGGETSDGKTDAVTSATVKTFDFQTLKDLKGKIPHARILDMDLSRVILGGNLIGGWAHARDLIYVSKLVKAYHHDWKVFETFLLAEKCGVNAIFTNPALCRVINEYWKRKIGKIQFISDCGGRDLLKMVKKSIDNGAAACYVQGGVADKLVRQGKVDEIAKALDLITRNGLPAGIGAHSIDTVKACVKHGLDPDFWMKTLHHHDYWSAKPKQRHDNVWCYDPEETVAFMQNLPQPWIAFKTLGAGAIHPNVGFPYAFENGADFICVGMYDFQIVQDVNIARGVLKRDPKRKRPWCA